jgi:hypothetical protein
MTVEGYTTIPETLWHWCLMARDAVDPETRLAARAELAAYALLLSDPVLKGTARSMVAVLKRRERFAAAGMR